MYIKSLVIDGFKSYGHRTEITGFDPQFNAITGLNGSGKSNILDSICFVLGITNLSHVRASNLQDLIYKSGQCGITQASVSLTFDNSNPEQSPPGLESIPEITITRQVLMGGKNKYLINGSTATSKKVQDLFCSVQLNVNNPHFLIMQGKITKVLNMKPYDILSMIEEAAGTRMYEVKRQAAIKTIQKKDAKLNELKTIMAEEVAPRIDKARQERAKYMELTALERNLEGMLKIYHTWEYVSLERSLKADKATLEIDESEFKNIEDKIAHYRLQIKNTESMVEDMIKQADRGGNEDLEKAETELKNAEKIQAKINSSLKSIKDEIDNETKKKVQLEKHITEDEKSLDIKQKELGKVEVIFKKLKDAESEDSEALAATTKHYEALCAGMEINEEGEAATVLQQLIKARQEATEAGTEIKKAQMQIEFCKSQLNLKQQQRVSAGNESLKLHNELKSAEVELSKLKNCLKQLNFDENVFHELAQRRGKLEPEIRKGKDELERFYIRRPHTQFRYKDPEPNFDRTKVFGVVCRLFKVKDESANLAIETAAGGRLYNVVIDTNTTGQKLLERGDLQLRTTFIPLNKFKGSRMSEKIVQIAQNLVGAENVQLGLSYVEYDKKFQIIMESIFGTVLICKDINIATKLAFDSRIRQKCVTLEGDVVDPAGTLSGGAPPKEGSILTQLNHILKTESELKCKEEEFQRIQHQVEQMRALKEKLDLQQNQVHLINERLQLTAEYRHKNEVAELETEIEKLWEKIKMYKEDELKYQNKIQELEKKVNKPKGDRDQQIKEAKKEMANIKAKADKSRKEWKEREREFEIFNGEIDELQRSLESTREQVKASEEAVEHLETKLDEIVANSHEINDKVSTLQARVKAEKAVITVKRKDVEKLNKQIETYKKDITKFEVLTKEKTHNIKKLQQEIKVKQTEWERKGSKNYNVADVAKMTEAEGRSLEKKIREGQEKRNALSRTVNTKVQSVLEQQEGEYNELKKKHKIVEHDKKKLLASIEILDKKKEEILKQAHGQISKDFGSIFGTLLPGANAKLEPPIGQTLLQGLEVKVALGDVWKESLTELSGGQRSLAALSLILAMLLFKPAPLYILDEVDAALDLSHTQNIGQMLKTHFQKSQFVIVSLKDGMFSNANVLFRTQFVDGVSTVTRTSKV